MKKSGKCPKCESTSIIKDVRTGEFHLSVPSAPWWKPTKGRWSFATAWVCTECGFIELYADKPKDLNQ